MFETILGSGNSDMNYNPYTPPSSNEDSPQSYAMNPSPQSYFVVNPTATLMETTQIQAQYSFEPQYVTVERERPYLVMIEQPTEKFRFRYKSEMAGTHGSLNGKNSDKTRKQTYPTVELKKFIGSAIVRCSLYQYHSSSKQRQPHAHRLIRKVGNEEVDDPHDLLIGGAEGYQAVFHSMGIIHTAKKNLIDELCRKKRLLKEEEVARTEEAIRKLKKDEVVNIKHEAEEESKSINMNIVCLRFDAFVKEDNVLYPLCEPIYSHSINNLKSALTGELKIVRMDHNSSPAKGNREVFMLVEKVTKKNIKIRFFETDEDDVEIWSDYGRFSELDVHHQYAIVFRTPPYRDVQISEQRKVFVELLRITDGSKSEAREFKYYPSPNYQPGMKRSRMSYSYSTSGSWTCSGEKQIALPKTITEHNFPSIESAELDKIFREVQPQLFLDSQNFTSIGSQDFISDGPREKFNEYIPRPEIRLSNEETQIIDRVHSEFKSFLATRPSSEMISGMLVNLFEEHEYVTEDQENALHLLVKSGNHHKLAIWLEAIKRSNEHQILNLPNKDGHTIGHLAVMCGNLGILDLICRYNPDFSLVDNEGNTPLHVAIKNSPLEMVDLLVRSKDITKLPINVENHDSLTALQLAIAKKNLSYVKILCEHGADVNTIDAKSGYNALHLSITEQSADIAKYLVDKTNIDLLCKSYQEITPYQMAKRLIQNESDGTMMKICDTIENAMEVNGLDTEIFIKEEQESEEEMECDFVECKPERYTPEELKEMYKNIKCFTSECLQEVSEMLDESGKWKVLAQLLDMEHIIHTDMFKKAPSKSKQLLQSAEKECNIYEIRDFLENLEELDAVVAMDKMVLSMQNIV